MIIFMILIVVTVLFVSIMIATIIDNFSVDMKMRELSKSNVLFKDYYSNLEDAPTGGDATEGTPILSIKPLESDESGSTQDSTPESGDGDGDGVDDEEIIIPNFKNIEDKLKHNYEKLEETLKVIFLTNESCQIVIADNTGKLVIHAFYSWSEKMPVINFFSQGMEYVSVIDSEYLTQDTMRDIKGEGDLAMSNSCHGLFDRSVIWFGSRLSNTVGEVDGYILTFASSDEQVDLFNSMINSIVLTVAWLLIVAIFSIYFVSHQMMKPLREIGNAAKSFARGKYDVRVPERGDDELTELARSFNKMAEDIQSKDDMQKQFLSNVSHDLRTPMTTIAGFIDGILDGAIPYDKQEYYLNIIKNEVQRLNRLVSSLLDISRLQSGYRKFDKKQFNICETMRQTVISFENQFNEKKLDVEVDVEHFDMYAYGDEDAINQVIYNICHNAIKFSYEGGRYIIRIKSTGTGKVQFSVYNEGIGIAKEDIPYVFDRFYKSDKSRGLDKSGVGLGLFISKTIIDEHKGEMRVDSEIGKWCEFSFTIPKGESN